MLIPKKYLPSTIRMRIIRNSLLCAILIGAIMTLSHSESVVDILKMQDEEITISAMANAMPRIIPLSEKDCIVMMTTVMAVVSASVTVKQLHQ